MTSSEMKIDDEELIYRRIPASVEWYNPKTKELDDEAFLPHYNRKTPSESRDITGLSVSRAFSKSHQNFLTAEMLCKNNGNKKYYIAILKVCDLREHGICIEADPVEDKSHPETNNLGHALLPEINSYGRDPDNRRKFATPILLWAELLAKKLTLEICGPFS